MDYIVTTLNEIETVNALRFLSEFLRLGCVWRRRGGGGILAFSKSFESIKATTLKLLMVDVNLFPWREIKSDDYAVIS